MTDSVTDVRFMTGAEVLDLLRITPTVQSGKVILYHLRQTGLRGVRRGRGFVYEYGDVVSFIESRKSTGITRCSQVATVLRLDPKWLDSEIRAGRLPGHVNTDGVAFADPRAVRQAMQQREQQQALEQARRQRGDA